MTIGERVRRRREMLPDFTQEKLAKLVGFEGRAAINKIEKGITKIPAEKIMAYAKALKTSPAYLMGWVDDPELTHEQTLELEQNGKLKPIILAADTGSIDGKPLILHSVPKHQQFNTTVSIALPVLGEVAAGMGAYADVNNYAIDYMNVPTDWLSSSENYCILKVTGNSMEPEICNGDYALIRCQPDLDSGSIGIVLIDNDSGLIKKVMKYENYVSLVSFNKDYEPRIFIGKDINRLRIFGVVKKIIRDF